MTDTAVVANEQGAVQAGSAQEPQAEVQKEETQWMPSENDVMRQRMELAEQRYKTLQGKYDAETARLRDAVLYVNQQLEALAQQQQAAPTQAQQYQVAADAKSRYGLTDQDMEFGEDLIKVAEKIANKIVQDRLDQLPSANVPQPPAAYDPYAYAPQYNQPSPQEQEAAFLQEVLSFVPNYAALQEEAAFKRWCTPEKQQAFDAARHRLDAASAAQLYLDYQLYKNQMIEHIIRNQAVPPKAAPAAPPATESNLRASEYKNLVGLETRGSFLTPEQKARLSVLEQAYREGKLINDL